MKIRTLLFFSALAGIAAPIGTGARPDAPAHNDGAHRSVPDAKGHLVKIDAKTDPVWLAKAKAEYPTDTCVVSQDKLGAEMGPSQDYIYREKEKPDRLVRFCCKDCRKDFNDDPAKYLGKIDEAAAGKSK